MRVNDATDLSRKPIRFVSQKHMFLSPLLVRHGIGDGGFLPRVATTTMEQYAVVARASRRWPSALSLSTNCRNYTRSPTRRPEELSRNDRQVVVRLAGGTSAVLSS